MQAGTDRLAGLSPEAIRARTFETLRQMFLNSSQRQPLVIAVENLHWIDQTSEACFASLIEGVAGARILVFVTYRPGYRPPWIEKSYATQMVLQPLSSQDSRQILRSVLQMEDIPEPLAQIILGKAQGNPFFVEEIVQALVEEGLLVQMRTVEETDRSPLPPSIEIPPTVQAVLAARIDRLPAKEKGLLQTLAVIGSAIPLHLITKVVGQPEDTLRQPLVALQAAEFLYEQPAWPELAYSFKHVLTQEVAYTSVPSERRRILHARTAQAIETLFEDRLEEHYGELAHHYRHSGNTEKAVSYLQRAGHQAMQRSAYAEAINLLTTGLELLQTLPDTQERTRQELELLLLLGPALMAIKGYTTPEVENVYARARSIMPTGGRHPATFQGAVGPVYDLQPAGEVPDATRAGGTTPWPGPTPPRPHPPPGRPPGVRNGLVLAGRVDLGPSAP